MADLDARHPALKSPNFGSMATILGARQAPQGRQKLSPVATDDRLPFGNGAGPLRENDGYAHFKAGRLTSLWLSAKAIALGACRLSHQHSPFVRCKVSETKPVKMQGLRERSTRRLP